MGIISKKWKIGVLVGYCLAIISIAILSRKQSNQINNYELFHTLKKGITDQVLANIIFFIPIGILLGSIGIRWLWLGLALSECIEISQLLFHKGMYDIDDIAFNCIGVILGFLLIRVIKLLTIRIVCRKAEKRCMKK